MEQLRSAKGFICDMDGVIYHGNRIYPVLRNLSNGCIGKTNSFCF